MRVALLTTGYTELMGLGATLHGLFPDHEFCAVPRIQVPLRPFAGMTSNALPAPQITVLPAAAKLAEAAVSLVDPEIRDTYDLAVVFDDLELANLHQPEVVLETFATAVSEHITGCTDDDARRERLRTQARDRISFHLAVPMIEAWFFADPTGPTTAGVPSNADIHFDRTQTDAERFRTGDPAYLAATEDACPCWSAIRGRRRKKDLRPKWLGSTDRAHHPKGYLQWLTIDGAAPSCTRYDEGRAGVTALEGLSWADVLRYRHRCIFARSLVHDLSDALGQPPRLARWQGDQADATRIRLGDAQRIIRNH